MTKFENTKTKAAQVWNKARNTMTVLAGILLGGVVAFGILTMSLTIGLMALGFATLVLLLALPFGALSGMRETVVEVTPEQQQAT